jgi:hypothetical protein
MPIFLRNLLRAPLRSLLTLLVVHQTGEQTAQRFELAMLLGQLLGVLLHHGLFDFLKEIIDIIRFVGQLHQSCLPRLQLTVGVLKLVHGLLEFHETPDAQLIPVIGRLRALELHEGLIELAGIVPQVGEIDTGLHQAGIKHQGTIERRDGVSVASQTVLCVAHAGHGLG